MNNNPTQRLLIAALVLVFALGAYLRIAPSTKFSGLGFDENYYRIYLTILESKGICSYPQVAQAYKEAQKDMVLAVIPPMRVTFLATAYLWHQLFSTGSLVSLRDTACLFSVLSLVVTAAFVWRMAGLGTSIGVTALMSCAPLQIQMAQRVYIDGVFAFWSLLTLWMFWETLRAPTHRGWLAGYGLSLALMVMTKENAAFVFVALMGIIVLNRWLQIGTMTGRLLIVSILGPALGVLVLVVAAGGLPTLIEVFKLNVEKSHTLPYAIKTGDGPWFRYAIDLLTMSPVVTLLSVAAIFQPRRNDKPWAYFAMFVVLSYIAMTNVKYGLNLRYSTIWDLPMRYLAYSQLVGISTLVARRYVGAFLGVTVAVACLTDLQHYYLFFAQNGVYDPIPDPLLHILNILK